MSNFTAIINADPRKNDKEIWNDPMGELDAAIGDLTTLTTTPKASVAGAIGATALGTTATTISGAIGEINTRVAGSIDTDGTLKAGAVDVAGVLAADVVNADKIENGALRVPNAMPDPFHRYLSPGVDWGNRVRWLVPSNLTVISDSNNARGKTLRMGTSSVTAGRAVWLDEAGIAIGDTLYAYMLCMAASGEFYLTGRFFTSAGVAVSAEFYSANFTPSGAETQVVITQAVPATAAYVMLYPVRVSGSANLDIYAWHVSNTPFYPTLPGAEESSLTHARIDSALPNLVFDPFNVTLSPGFNWGGYERWVVPQNLSIVDPDASNPYGGRTLRMEQVSTVGGKIIYVSDGMGIEPGTDYMYLSADVSAASGDFYIQGTCYNAAGASTGNIDGTVTTLAGRTTLTASAILPAATVKINVYLVRDAGATDLDIYGIWAHCGYKRSPAMALDWLTTEVASIRDTHTKFGETYLKYWQLALANVQQAVSGEQAVIAVVGDSWVDNTNITLPLRTWLQTTYGDAGAGYVSANTAITAPAAVTRARSGTWTELDNNTTPVGYGVDIGNATSTADTDTLDITATVDTMVIHYIKQDGGGVLKYRFDDGGLWTTVDTADAGGPIYATEVLSTLGGGSVKLNLGVDTQGTAGVMLCGVDCQLDGSGVRLHKLGNGGATAAQYESATAAIWQAGLAAIAPDLVVLLLGTNDHAADVVPGTFAGSMNTLIDRVQAAVACDIMLLSPGPNGTAGTAYTVDQYVDQLRWLATKENAAMVNAYSHLLDYASDGVGGWANSTHLNASGGQVIANEVIRMLRAQ